MHQERSILITIVQSPTEQHTIHIYFDGISISNV